MNTNGTRPHALAPSLRSGTASCRPSGVIDLHVRPHPLPGAAPPRRSLGRNHSRRIPRPQHNQFYICRVDARTAGLVAAPPRRALRGYLSRLRLQRRGRNLQISLRSLRVIRDLAVHRTRSIERSLLCLNAVVDELVPLAVQVDRAQVQHGLRALSFPTHPS